MFIIAVGLFIMSMAMFVDGSSGSRSKWATAAGILFIVAAFIALMVSADPH